MRVEEAACFHLVVFADLKDGSRIVTASKDQTAKVWDAKTGTEVLTLKGHISDVNSASFSSDGSRVVTASRDGTAKVWDARSMAEVRANASSPR
jgi:WD40 repeat protein